MYLNIYFWVRFAAECFVNTELEGISEVMFNVRKKNIFTLLIMKMRL